MVMLLDVYFNVNMIKIIYIYQQIKKGLIMSVTISQRIKSLLALNGKTSADLARFMEISPQGLNNKFARGSFNTDDLIKIAEFTGSKLVFEGKAGNIVLDADCIRSSVTDAG